LYKNTLEEEPLSEEALSSHIYPESHRTHPSKTHAANTLVTYPTKRLHSASSTSIHHQQAFQLE